jgi:hypothetical protein
MRGAALLMLLAWALPAAAAELPGEGRLADAACIDCHAGATAAWRDGPHGTAADAGCVACHGQRHSTAGSRARRSESCIGCHGGEQGASARSYLTSKHGVIATLEGSRWDWSQPLLEANYRAPTCAYCHMHDGAHGRMLSIDVLETACSDCHSPRYVETLFAAGRRMLGIGELKLAEATAAAGADPEPEIGRMLETMRTRTLGNLRLGIGHQSPDYQWWYGHAALDGDLLRIKSALSRNARQRARSDRKQ